MTAETKCPECNDTGRVERRDEQGTYWGPCTRRHPKPAPSLPPDATTPTDEQECPKCDQGYVDDPLSSACGGRPFTYCDCPAGHRAADADYKRHHAARSSSRPSSEPVQQAAVADTESTIAFLRSVVEAADAGYWALHKDAKPGLDSDARHLLCLLRDDARRNLNLWLSAPASPTSAEKDGGPSHG